MPFSQRFLNLVDQQLSTFDSDPELEIVVAYVAITNQEHSPTLEVVGQRPKHIQKVLAPIENDPDLRVPSSNRRWYPLQEGSILLGVLRAERFPTENQWPEALDEKLQSSASVLANCISLELEREKLSTALRQQKDQIGVLVHQLRNPLTALRTYAQLLLRKLDSESTQRNLVEALLTEQKQVDKYLFALDEMSKSSITSNVIAPARLLLPPFLPTQESLDLMELLSPLIDRAEATAKLQGFVWVGPKRLPSWIQEPRPIDQGFIAEIVANLLENAFRYSSVGSSIGICFNQEGICVWDSGKPIPISDREKIFERGFRGKENIDLKGSGLGLSLARELTKQFNGELKLIANPSSFDKSLPLKGNAFVISFQA